VAELRLAALKPARTGSAMRAAIFRKGEIVVGEVAEPKPGPGQVLVKTLACGICGTDLHARVHADKMIEMSKYLPWRKPTTRTKILVLMPSKSFCQRS
jgi:NADPH:quinone reductase-like Zn-dependent oxidoreductase